MPPAKKILIVEDDFAIRNLIERFLSKQGYQMKSAADGRTGLEIFEQFNPDLAILDINLPEGPGGLSLCKTIRERTGMPIMILTSEMGLDFKKKAFELGADDYQLKPFYVEELQWRVEALFKRPPLSDKPSGDPPIIFDGLVLDPYRHEISLNDKPIVLTSLEFNLLHILACERGRVWRRKDLIQKLYDLKEGEHMGDVRVIDVHIGQIRKKIETDIRNPQWIKTVHGVGYKFEGPSVQKDHSPRLESQAS